MPDPTPQPQPAPDPWQMYRDSGCTCQVEDAAGFPTIVLYDEKCPIASHRVCATFWNLADDAAGRIEHCYWLTGELPGLVLIIYDAHAAMRAEHEQMRQRLERAEEALRWREMKDAPRDGSEVLLRVKSRAGIPGKMLVGHYMPGGHCIEDHPPIAEGWYFWNGCMFDKASEPVAWLPLPPTSEPTPNPQQEQPVNANPSEPGPNDSIKMMQNLGTPLDGDAPKPPADPKPTDAPILRDLHGLPKLRSHE